jgi:hypothetical protein
MNKWVFPLILFLAFSSAHNLGASDDCSLAAGSTIYSNAYLHKETEDVLGYELAIKQHDTSTVEAFLYIYEGAPNKEAIPLTGQLINGQLNIRGNWVEHLIEYPSKKETVQTHAVEIIGTLKPASFRGDFTIEGFEKKESVNLKRVDGIWLCKR